MDAELRAWQPSDAAALLRAVDESPDLAHQFGDAELASLDRCLHFIETGLAPSNDSVRNFAITVAGDVVGNIGVSSMEDRHGTGWCYYWLSAEARGRGLATRGLASVAQWSFDTRGLFRLELGHRLNNPESCRVAVNAGFLAEGIERGRLRYGDERFDVETHARLATDPSPPVDTLRIR